MSPARHSEHDRGGLPGVQGPGRKQRFGCLGDALTTQHRHDRIFALRHLNAYPGGSRLDMTFWLPPSEDAERRVWALVPDGSPIISIDDTRLAPQRVASGPPRWVDYGTPALPAGFTQLRIEGMAVSECSASHLVVTAQLDLSLDGLALEQAELALWGLARADAGATTLRPSRLTVGSPAAFVVRYAAGPKGLPQGARRRPPRLPGPRFGLEVSRPER
jgi:hypothetical protein